MPSVNSRSMPNVWPSSTFTTPSLPTFSMASAMTSPISSSPAEMVATRAICSLPLISLDCDKEQIARVATISAGDTSDLLLAADLLGLRLDVVDDQVDNIKSQSKEISGKEQIARVAGGDGSDTSDLLLVAVQGDQRQGADRSCRDHLRRRRGDRRRHRRRHREGR